MKKEMFEELRDSEDAASTPASLNNILLLSLPAQPINDLCCLLYTDSHVLFLQLGRVGSRRRQGLIWRSDGSMHRALVIVFKVFNTPLIRHPYGHLALYPQKVSHGIYCSILAEFVGLILLFKSKSGNSDKFGLVNLPLVFLCFLRPLRLNYLDEGFCSHLIPLHLVLSLLKLYATQAHAACTLDRERLSQAAAVDGVVVVGVFEIRRQVEIVCGDESALRVNLQLCARSLDSLPILITLYR